SAKDIKDEKIQQYRKTLTKIVKIKTAIFHETVKVTCSKDGKMLEWYKGKNDSDGKKKPIGSFPLNKITSIRTKVDNLKSLEISVSSVHISTYLFTFKTREERESWQNNLESFRKIMSMK
nr:Chain A, C-terminal PH domain from PfAPH [Plasmodium falciparum Tanzania (2000708)]